MKFATDTIMSRDIAVVYPDESMHHVYFKMKQSYIRYMPVIDKNGTIIGIITDQELNRPIPSKARVSDYMSTTVGQASAETPLFEIAKRIMDLRLSAIAIHENKKIVGIIAARELVSVLVPFLAPENALQAGT